MSLLGGEKPQLENTHSQDEKRFPERITRSFGVDLLPQRSSQSERLSMSLLLLTLGKLQLKPFSGWISVIFISHFLLCILLFFPAFFFFFFGNKSDGPNYTERTPRFPTGQNGGGHIPVGAPTTPFTYADYKPNPSAIRMQVYFFPHYGVLPPISRFLFCE